MKIKCIFFNQDFYDSYSKAEYPEIPRKISRPYVMLKVTIDDIDFGIPLRSNIRHPHAIFTRKEKKSGLDLSKSIIITDTNYISPEIPELPQEDWDLIKQSKFRIKQRLESYIDLYKDALKNQQIRENKLICKYSTLQYFHAELGIPKNIDTDVEKETTV